MTSEGDIYPGEHSRRVGLTIACLVGESEELPKLTCLTKGIVYELSLLRKSYAIPWSQFYDWAKTLQDTSFFFFFAYILSGSYSHPYFGQFFYLVCRYLEKKEVFK